MHDLFTIGATDVDVDLRETSSLAITNLESISLLALIENGDVNLHNVKVYRSFLCYI